MKSNFFFQPHIIKIVVFVVPVVFFKPPTTMITRIGIRVVFRLRPPKFLYSLDKNCQQMANDVLDLVDIYITVHHGIDSQGGDALHTELLHDVLAMRDHRRQTASFSMMFLRCVITVVRPMFSWSAISLLIYPCTISASTSISRSVSTCARKARGSGGRFFPPA